MSAQLLLAAAEILDSDAQSEHSLSSIPSSPLKKSTTTATVPPLIPLDSQPKTSLSPEASKYDAEEVPNCSDGSESTSVCSDQLTEDEDEPLSVPARSHHGKASKRPSQDVQFNSLEKQRRAQLASCYNRLKSAIPSIAGTKASNVHILRTAQAFILVSLRACVRFLFFLFACCRFAWSQFVTHWSRRISKRRSANSRRNASG